MKLMKKTFSLVLAVAMLLSLVVLPANANAANTVNGFTAYEVGGLVGGTDYDPNISLNDCGGTDRVLVSGRGGTNYGDPYNPRSTMGVYSEAKYRVDGLEILYSVESWIGGGDHWYAIALTENKGEWFENDGSDKALFFQFAYNNGNVVLSANYIGNGAGWTGIGTSQGVAAAGGQYSIRLDKVAGGYSVYMKNADQSEYTLQNFGGTTVLSAELVNGLFTDGKAYLTAGAYVATYDQTWSFVLGAHEKVIPSVNGFTAYEVGGLVGGTTYDPNITLNNYGGTDRVLVSGRGGTNYGDPNNPRSTMGVYSEEKYNIDGLEILYSVESWIGGGDHWYAIALTENYGEWFENDGSDKALFFQFAYNNGNVTLAAHHIGNGAGWSYVGTSQGVPAAGGQYSIRLDKVDGGYSVYMKNAGQSDYTLQNFGGVTVLSSDIVDGLFTDGKAYLTAGAYVATYDQTWSFVLGAHEKPVPVSVNGFAAFEVGGLVGGTTYDPNITLEDCGSTDRVKATGRGGTNYGDPNNPRSTMGVYSVEKYDIDDFEILYSVESWIGGGDHWYAIALTENYGEWFENDGSDKALFFQFAYNNGNVTLAAHHIGNGAGWSYIGTSQGVPAVGGQYSIYLDKVDGGYNVYMKNAEQSTYTLQNFGGVTVIPSAIVDGLFPSGEAYLMAGAYVATYADPWSFVLGATDKPHFHNWVVDESFEPTCEEQGYTVYTCACGATENRDYVDALGHDYTYTDNGDDHTVGCSRCDYSVTEAHTFVEGVCVCGATETVEVPIRIKSAYLRINEDINVVFTAEIPDGCEDPYMVIDFMGNSFEIEDYTMSEGLYCFEFKKVLPMYLGENMTATVYATKDGETVSDVVADYSVKAYCISMIEKNPDDTALKTLLSDVLVYGAAAQNYTGYKTNALVTNGLDLTPSTFTAIEKQKATFTGEKSDDVDWTSATIALSNELAVRFYFNATSTDGLTIDVSIGDRTETFDADDFGVSPSGKYFVSLRGIKATEFDETVTASFKQNGTAIGRTVSYSVNTYISGVQDYSDATVAALAQALYNYGASAAAYSAK